MAGVGRLLRLTSDDLQWLADTEPAVKSRLAASLAERLQNRQRHRPPAGRRLARLSPV